MDSVLDLCLSCANHVSDGSAYCSSECFQKDQSQSQNAFLSTQSRSQYAASSSGCSRSRPQPASSSVAGSWPLTYELGPRSAPQQLRLNSPIHKYSGRDRQGIAIWAQGVYGGGQYVCDSEPSTSSSGSFFNHDSSDEESDSLRSSRKSRSSKRTSSKRSSLPVSHSAPRFPLTAAHLAPPTVISIHTLPHPSHTSVTTADDDCSLMTPQSSPSSSSLVNKVRSWTMASPKNMDTTPTRATRVEELSSDDANPWISSPPYDFSLRKHVPSPMAAPQRGRPLVRQEW
ncbi:hypothetical protein FRC03_001661 [Tulasnella sp. 419]|nr:hypothetical protein FRC02_004794 [Tulasnella sp. 418]KAG8964557.1 hypothetical protein FRC03_001661 [Tulasnella sp. 419]